METTPKISSEKNLSSAGSVMGHIMLQSAQTERNKSAIFILFKMK
jgi:hypothetical protein